ncbi:hypothetical protein ZIOFF_041801 [Zingiber officinale]|uniref:Uncharacterized protein n=1 Tax=Zingiber officinale TaxID=94328 RepID=A0A8J5GJ73_ZINOF|nr:hypothetical protein ZIOFF_041801 [Zingiber officinale]
MVWKNSNSVGGPWRLADEMHAPAARCTGMEAECLRRFHRHEPLENQCSSSVVNHIKAPVQLVEILSLFSRFLGSWRALDFSFFILTVLFLVGGDSIRFLCQVWSLVRRFDQPQSYKPFVSRCIMRGDFAVGCLREVNVKSGLPATTSTERLEQLDDNEHILGIKIVGGDHRLQNYSSVLTVHPEILDGGQGTLVVESFIVDVPEGNTKDYLFFCRGFDQMQSQVFGCDIRTFGSSRSDRVQCALIHECMEVQTEFTWPRALFLSDSGKLGFEHENNGGKRRYGENIRIYMTVVEQNDSRHCIFFE